MTVTGNAWPYRRPADPRRAQVLTLFEGGWTDPRQIQSLMARDGSTPPHLLTIRRWIDPAFAASCRASSARHMRKKRAQQSAERARTRAETQLDGLTEVEMWELALEVACA